jgi:hypothetical protein
VNNWRFEKLNPKKHDRADFDCGEESLNLFLKLYAAQQQKRGFCTTYVCIEHNTTIDIKPILGYYTVSASSMEAESADYFSKRKLPYKKLPTLKIGRLARDIHKSPKGFGGDILGAALIKCLETSENLGIWAIEVDLINEKVKPFYQAFEFQEFPDLSLRMALTIDTLRESCRY